MSSVFGRTPIGATRRGVIGFSLAASGMAALAACSDDGGGELDVEAQSKGAMENFAADTQFTATEPFTLSVLWTDWPDLPITDKWQFFKEIEKRTNVKIEVTNIPFSDATEKRSLLISAGDAPTVIPLVYTGEENSFVSSGAILPMSDYVEHMPNFQKYVEEWDLGDMIDNLKQADGKYYMLPGLQEVSVPVFTLVIRKDVFETVAGGIPQTWDEMRAALVKIKAAYPDSKPLADGFEGASMLNYAAHAFGAQAGWGFGSGMIDDGSGGLQYTAATDGYKQMVEFFRGLVEDGLLDTDSMTASNDGSGGGSVTEKVAAELVFAASGSAGTAIEFATALNETVGEGNYEILQIAPPGGPAGQICEPRNFWNGFMLNAEIADSENFVAILQFLDWLYYNQEARELLRWGVLDETYTKDASGKITLKPEFRLDAYGINHPHAARPEPAGPARRDGAGAGFAPGHPAEGHRGHRHAAVHHGRPRHRRMGRLRRRARGPGPPDLRRPHQHGRRPLRGGELLVCLPGAAGELGEAVLTSHCPGTDGRQCLCPSHKTSSPRGPRPAGALRRHPRPRARPRRSRSRGPASARRAGRPRSSATGSSTRWRSCR
jgi:putative aldouronate transport system substrate-binding protein